MLWILSELALRPFRVTCGTTCAGESQITSVCCSLLTHRKKKKKKEECLPVWMETEICCRSNRFRLRPIRWVCIQSWRQGAYLCCPNSDNHVGWFHCCTSSHKITRHRCNLSCCILLQHNCFQEIRSLLKWKHVSTDRHLSKETNACVCLCLCTFCKHRWT